MNNSWKTILWNSWKDPFGNFWRDPLNLWGSFWRFSFGVSWMDYFFWKFLNFLDNLRMWLLLKIFERISLKILKMPWRFSKSIRQRIPEFLPWEILKQFFFLGIPVVRLHIKHSYELHCHKYQHFKYLFEDVGCSSTTKPCYLIHSISEHLFCNYSSIFIRAIHRPSFVA